MADVVGNDWIQWGPRQGVVSSELVGLILNTRNQWFDNGFCFL